jgi:hypothetical protein
LGFRVFCMGFLDFSDFGSTIQTKTFFVWISGIFVWISDLPKANLILFFLIVY